MLLGVGCDFKNHIIELLSDDRLCVLSPVDFVVLNIVFHHNINREIATVHSDEIGRLFEDVTDSDGASEVRSDKVCPSVIDSEQMQVNVEHHGASVFGVNFQLLHGVNRATIDVEELVIYHTM